MNNSPLENRTRVKICGITNLVDAEAAVVCGADALGFIFHEPSPRYISPRRASEIIKRLPPFINTVGVFVNVDKEEVLKTANECLLNAVQLHGDEDPDYCETVAGKCSVIKAVRVKDEGSLQAMSRYPFAGGFLLDSYSQEVFGGSGEKFDWSLARAASESYKIILAGGLHPDNVAEAIKEVRPYGVDVSSGVEKEPGIKDHEKLKEFFKALTDR